MSDQARIAAEKIAAISPMFRLMKPVAESIIAQAIADAHGKSLDATLNAYIAVYEKLKASVRELTRQRDEAIRRAEWRDIESAPKDGAKFIGLCGGLAFACYRATYNNYEPAENGGRKVGGQYGGWSRLESDAVVPCDPSHWIPLPEPPALEAALAETKPTTKGE